MCGALLYLFINRACTGTAAHVELELRMAERKLVVYGEKAYMIRTPRSSIDFIV
jgi:hypothetical protein